MKYVSYYNMKTQKNLFQTKVTNSINKEEEKQEMEREHFLEAQ